MSEAIAASLSLDEVVSTLSDSALSEVRSDLVMTWLADGEGNFALRSLNYSSLLEEGEELGELDPAKVTERLDAGAIIEHGARARELFMAHPSRRYSSMIVGRSRCAPFAGFRGHGVAHRPRRFEGAAKLAHHHRPRAAAAIERQAY